jgi:hypothetical protein
MLVDIDPMEMMLCDNFEGVIFDRSIPPSSSNNRILVDGLTISAHRLFGLVSHQIVSRCSRLIILFERSNLSPRRMSQCGALRWGTLPAISPFPTSLPFKE